jgi:glycosyltransferase involved in cell wall biosynthesis
MRIGIVAPPWVAVPPPRYGGTEAVLDNLARGLAARGHTVRLFTVRDSTCPVERRWIFDQAAGTIRDAELEGVHALAAYEALHDVDVVHDHTVLGPLLAAASACPRIPTAFTVHGPVKSLSGRVLAQVARHAALVAISHGQRRSAPHLPFAAVIHHGIDTDVYSPGPGGGGYLLFVGRMSPAKGVHRAVAIARRAGMPLVVVAKMWDPAEVEYFRSAVEPLLHPGVELLLDADRGRRIELLQRAEALLNPICWPEPFGLVMAEALACGTPVVGSPCGAAPEIVDDGRTGFLRESDDDLVAALARLGDLNRSDCRIAAVQRFSVQRMAQDHEALYECVTAPGEPVHVPEVGRWRQPGRAASRGWRSRAV